MTALDGTAGAAAELVRRTGLAPSTAAILAILDAASRGAWTAGPLEALIEAHPDREELARRLDELRRAGAVLATPAGLALDPIAQRALAGEPAPELPRAPFIGAGAGARVLAERLARPGLTLVSGASAGDRLAAIREAALGPGEAIRLDDGARAIEAARSAWLRGALLVVEATGALDWLPGLVAIPARIAICVEAAGEALAILRGQVHAIRIRPGEPVIARAPVPDVLAPLVGTSWKGLHTDVPQHRTAMLHGDREAIERAVEHLGAGLGVLPCRVDASGTGGIARAQAALATRRLVWLEGVEALAVLETHVLAALIHRGTGCVVVAAGPRAEALRAEIALEVA